MRCAVGVALVACSGPDRGAHRPLDITRPPVHAPSSVTAPGLRLPDDITPLHYDLSLVVDPDRETFTGEVKIRVRVERATDHVWIHADQLTINTARYGDSALTQLPVPGDEMLGFGFGKTVQPGELELSFTYVGKTTGEQEGLFRQKSGTRWYLFSQGESVFARRILPCFDEPRFKTPWRVTIEAPRMLEVFANMPQTSTDALDSSRKRVRFDETPPMPSYLLALAVGPFDVEQLAPVGKNKIPVRVVVRAGAGGQTRVVEPALLAVVDELEAYMGEPLPLEKLDLVAVPEFFGAMENPGLITFQSGIFVGKDTKQRRQYFSYIAAHELAHQWFGNAVTPAWWDDLWLSESFASWLGDKVARKVGALDARPLHGVLERRDALLADASPTAKPLRRAIAANRDPEDAFDAIAYQKGEAVLATFEALVGEDAFRDALRDYVRDRRNRTTTSAELVAALGRKLSPDVGKAFEQYATQVGAPVVDLALRCDAKPAVIATARDQRLVPVCVRAASAKTSVCALAGDKTELLVGAKCPAWIDANPRAGYYTVHWLDRPSTQWLAKLDPPARVMIGDDLAASVRRGEVTAKDAVAELRELLDSGDPHAQLAAVPLVEQIDELVDDNARAAWSAWLARHLPRMKAAKKRGGGPRDVAIDAAWRLNEMFPPELARPEVVKEAREHVDKAIKGDAVPAYDLIAFAAVGNDADALFDRIVDRARATNTGAQEDWLQALGAFPARFAERIAALAVDKAELPTEMLWDALAAYFDRSAARASAWKALRPRLDFFMKRAAPRGGDMLDAVASLCDAAARAEVATAFAPYVDKLPDGRGHLARTLAAIDTCVARKARVGDLSAAITSSR